MKKQIVIGALAIAAILTGANNVQAQNNVANTTVNITLADVISIDAGSAAIDGVINFNYATAQDYNSVQTWNVPSSLIVTSTKSFDVKVKANGTDFVKGSDKIPVNVLTIKPMAGGTTTMGGTKTNVVLSTTDQVLISAAPLGSAQVLELNYEIPAIESSSSKILGKPAGAYTQTVTYTATAN